MLITKTKQQQQQQQHKNNSNKKKNTWVGVGIITTRNSVKCDVHWGRKSNVSR